MTDAVQQRLLDILDYWHKIEFFIPFDLNQVTETQDDWKLRWLSREQLARLPGAYFSQLVVPPERRITGYRLYLGIFDKSEIARACAPALSAGQGYEEEERAELEGRTCFARIALDALGTPLFDPISVSTVPWALGRVARHGLDSLGLDGFESGLAALKDSLQNFRASRASADRTADPAPLSGAEILALHALLAEWAGFAPDDGQPPALLEIVTASKVKAPPAGARSAARADAPDDENKSEDDAEAAGGAEPQIDILNSFYIEDIESAMRELRGGAAIPPLAAYLTPLAAERRIDLYTDAGRERLLRLLHPSRGNRGHWLEDDGRAMSLMQQFAINAGLDELAEQGLFAVNGPPGTGKTTLLREIFAENIVRRASVLAGLEQAADAFTSKVAVSFANTGGGTTIGRLRPELTGFEMVVASSNNAAVENISRDLPKSRQLGRAWAGSRYLQTVAQRLAAEDEDGNIRALPDGDRPWGLISCALGNSRNRRRFVSKFYYANKNAKGAADPGCRNIRQWAAEYAGPGFRQARADYRAAEQRVEQRRGVLARCADLWQALREQSAVQFCLTQRRALDEARQAAAQAGRLLAEAENEAAALRVQQLELAETERLLDRSRPGFWARLFGTAAAKRHRAEVADNADSQRAARTALSGAKQRQAGCAARADAACAAVPLAQAALDARQRDRQAREAELARLCAELGLEGRLPASASDLERDVFQIGGLWHDRALAGLRSALFERALALHEAWLGEVGRQGGRFSGNLFAIAKLLEGKRPETAGHAALIWQSLFMVVPVVSTTFASFARQFRDLGTGDLGWLFIDEAGQAVPQAAVGALWRARRAVVVGDPRQIEPVFTVPLALIRALSRLSPHTAAEGYAPDKVSVQRLADDANRYGTLAPEPGSDGLWIGSPLRVHRRCADPMFSLSNAIAYDGKMVFGLASRLPSAETGLGLGESAWIQVGGAAAFKQVVPEQVDFMAALVAGLYARDGALPAAYLISPFKAVKNALKKRLLEMDWTPPPGCLALKKKELRDWCRDRVGTVHTFQGKEEGTVFMVLGTDADHAGAAAWAASKPNLLNVALTRAQHHFYMVGDADVWRGLPYFSEALAALRPVPARAFLDGLS